MCRVYCPLVVNGSTCTGRLIKHPIKFHGNAVLDGERHTPNQYMLIVFFRKFPIFSSVVILIFPVIMVKSNIAIQVSTC